MMRNFTVSIFQFPFIQKGINKFRIFPPKADPPLAENFEFRILRKQLSNLDMRGFTMLELLLYMAMLTVFMGVLATLFGTVVDMQLESNANTSVDRDIQYIYARLTYDIHRATSITVPASNGTTEPSLTVTIGGNNYTYSTDLSGNLQYTNNLGTFVLNSYDTKISNLLFTRIHNTGGLEDTVTVSFTLTSIFIERKGIEKRDFKTTIGLRRQI